MGAEGGGRDVEDIAEESEGAAGADSDTANGATDGSDTWSDAEAVVTADGSAGAGTCSEAAE